MLERFYPDEYLPSAYVIDYEGLRKKGYQGLLFDIDNTLVPHGAPASQQAIALFTRLKRLGFRCLLLSNNKRARVESFNRDVKVSFIERAGKPSVKAYRKAMQMLGTDETNTICIGDQLFTDIWGANRAGIRTILVKPIHPKEEIQIVLKRIPEKLVLYFYRKKLQKEKAGRTG